MNQKIVIKGGNAYRLRNGSLQSCAVLADDRVAGELDPNEWYEVSEPTSEAEEARRELSS